MLSESNSWLFEQKCFTRVCFFNCTLELPSMVLINLSLTITNYWSYCQELWISSPRGIEHCNLTPTRPSHAQVKFPGAHHTVFFSFIFFSFNIFIVVFTIGLSQTGHLVKLWKILAELKITFNKLLCLTNIFYWFFILLKDAVYLSILSYSCTALNTL